MIGCDETYIRSLATTCFLSKSIIHVDFYALEIFCRVFNFSTLKLEYAKLLARSIFKQYSMCRNGYSNFRWGVGLNFITEIVKIFINN